MNVSHKVTQCYGCGACKNICPFDAIEIKEDDSGFLYAYVNEEKCKECGKCLKVCPALENSFENTESPQCYAAWAKDEVRSKCASGGIFTAVALQIIERGGWVAGAVWAEDYHVEFKLTNTLEGLQEISNSKYVQGNIGTIYSEIKEKLDKDNEVLFCGCPCQVAGLKSFLGKEYKKLYTMDLICHGVPSQKILKKYLEDTYNYENIQKVDFRDKSYFGWASEMNVYLKDGNVVRKKAGEDKFYQAFLKNLSLNPTCEKCQFSRMPRQGDMTLGDFWQIEKYDVKLNDRKGTSLVLINNEKGQSLFDECSNIAMKQDVPFMFIGETCNSVVFRPFKHHFGSERFLKEFSKKNFAKSVDECLNFHYDIGLITTWFARNFGAIFTAYALYTKLQDMGYSVLMLHKPIELWGNAYLSQGRSTIAIDFGRRYYNVSKQYSVYDGEQSIANLNNHCDIFMTGSDQLWNPKIYAKLFYFFMNFVDDKHKKIAYATSIGANKFEGTMDEKYQIEYLLSRFDKISVREHEAVNVCKNDLGVDARQVIDPVFLLDASHYEHMTELAAEKKEQPEEFIFAYILDGNIAKRKYINKISEKYNLPVVCAYDIEHPEMSKRFLQLPEATITKPEDWLWYIKNSKLVVTDSYHGACFSIIFNKEFICFGNKLRGINRFLELFSKLKIRNRLIIGIEEQEEVVIPQIKKEIDYGKVRILLEREKKKGLLWLEEALKERKHNKMAHEDYLFDNAERKINKLSDNFNRKLHMTMYSNISQLGLGLGCSVEEIIERMENNSYFQQVQGRKGEPIIDTPAPFGVLTIKKTSDYFIEVTFSEMTGKTKKPVLWLANVTEKKVKDWSKFVEQSEIQALSQGINENHEAINKLLANSQLRLFSDISQLGLGEGCSVQDIVERLDNNTYFQQVQGKIGEPISDTPAPFGILTIKKTTKYFIEVTFSEIASNEKPSCMWIANVIDEKVQGWSRMLGKGELDLLKQNMSDEMELAKKRVEELEEMLKKLLTKYDS